MNAVNWFEIPSLDLEKAFGFYSQVLGADKVRMGTFGGLELVLFNVPFASGEAVGGAIVKRPDLIPTTNGPIIYINTFGELDNCLNRVEANGGKIVVPKMDLGSFGFSAVILDAEGNKIGFHQNK